MSEEQTTYTYIPRIHHEPEPMIAEFPIAELRADIERLQDGLSSMARYCANLNLRLVELERAKAELEERIDRLIVAQRELRELRNDDVLERTAVALEYIASDIGSYVGRQP